MRFRRAKKEESQLGMTPLIDVVFLLLIFFMLTSTFHVASGVPIKLPEVAQRAVEEEGRKIVLVMNREGDVYMEGKRVVPEALLQKLKILSEQEAPVHLVLQADREAKHGNVVQLMDLARRAGIHSILIAASWKPEMVF